MMRADQLVNRCFSLKQVWGVHIAESPDGELQIQALLLENNKDTLFVKERLELQGLNQLTGDVLKNIPVSIGLDTPHVLFRAMDEAAPSVMAEQLHINNLDDFVIQTSELEQGYQAALIRRSLFNEWLEVFKRNQVRIVSIVLGPIHFSACLDYLVETDTTQSCEMGNYTLQWRQHSLLKMERRQQRTDHSSELQLGTELISSKEVLSYCNALAIILYGDDVPYITQQLFSSNVTANAYQQLYTRVMPVCLGFLLVLLLGNFFALQHFKGMQQQLSMEYAGYQQAHRKLETLQQQFEEHKRLAGQLDARQYGSFAFYADRLAATLKGRVGLSSLDLHPWHTEKDKLVTHYLFQKDLIIVTGTCQTPVLLSQWISDLSDEEFVESVSRQSYDYDEWEKTGRFLFHLNVKQP